MRAKMRCESVTNNSHGTEEVKFSAVNGKDGTANAQWAKYTPNGNIYLALDNPTAKGHFVPGNFYFVDFSEALEDG